MVAFLKATATYAAFHTFSTNSCTTLVVASQRKTTWISNQISKVCFFITACAKVCTVRWASVATKMTWGTLQTPIFQLHSIRTITWTVNYWHTKLTGWTIFRGNTFLTVLWTLLCNRGKVFVVSLYRLTPHSYKLPKGVCCVAGEAAIVVNTGLTIKGAFCSYCLVILEIACYWVAPWITQLPKSIYCVTTSTVISLVALKAVKGTSSLYTAAVNWRKSLALTFSC